MGKRIARLLRAHPGLKVPFRDADLRRLDGPTKRGYLAQLQQMLGIDPPLDRKPGGVEQVIEAVMRDANRPMTIDEIVEAVAPSGYTFSLADIRDLVTQKLSRRRTRFAKSRPGVYRLSGQRSGAGGA